MRVPANATATPAIPPRSASTVPLVKASRAAQAQARVVAEVQQWFRSQGAGSVRYGQQISNMRLLFPIVFGAIH